MIPYVVLLLILVVTLTFSKKNIIFYYISLIIMIFFSGLRSHVGVDYDSYLEIFENIANSYEDNIFNYPFEPLNVVIVKIILIIGFSNQFIFLIYSFITMLGIGYFVKKMSVSKEFSMFIFLTISIYYLSTLNGIRQWVAISMILVSIVNMIEKKHIKSMFFFIIASLFHSSSMIFLIMPFLIKRWPKKILIIIFSLSVVFAKLIFFIIENSKYSIYIKGLNFDQKGSYLFFSLYILVILGLIVFLGYFNQSVNFQKKEIVLINMSILSLFTLIVLNILEIDFLTLMRVNMYFQPQLIILIPLVISKINKSARLSFTYFSLIFCTSYFLSILYFKGEDYMLTPYSF